MALRFLGKDPDSPSGDSPTIWEDTEAGEYVIQGYIVTSVDTLATVGELPNGETVLRLPKRMMQFFPEVNGDARSES
ncbi:hypothetical protein IMZ11_41145 [Microtetraspora sp. AC03309]|uniref:hypothetical protein n=1 Tax=Microtetraspora sp. AC03309 TaxID=2779376 RepID=UPI001E2876A8|nr:hypothetical protein [Microtetraspora sp. AC03309]MCC5582025.1 hypothetical protein [Microtetraspora sp. AC03309]